MHGRRPQNTHIMPSSSPVWSEWYKGGIFPGYTAHREARCRHCIAALVRKISTGELNAFAAGERTVPPRKENEIEEECE